MRAVAVRPLHGGNLVAAAKQFGVPVEKWIDLSTGISPWAWPVPDIPDDVWRTLPYPDGQLERAAAAIYGCSEEALLAVPGSQYALQYIPELLPLGKVAMPLRGYAEHRVAWAKAGHTLIDYCDIAALQELVHSGAVNHAVLINPNNPTGEFLPQQSVHELHAALHARSGFMIVDEAFSDATPDLSCAPSCPAAGLIVFRSLGKFFGLAGIRLGFLLAPKDLCSALEASMPPWLLSHPARWIGAAALADQDWQSLQRTRLQEVSTQWFVHLQAQLPDLKFVRTPLFISASGDAALCEAVHHGLGQRGVLLRLFEEYDGRGMLRFGLPAAVDRAQVHTLLQDTIKECL